MFTHDGLSELFVSKVTTESECFSVLMWIENHGGLSGILEKLREHDLNHTVDSWLGEGANFSIYPSQILNIINTDELDDLAIECDTDLPGAAQLLASALPRLTDGLSEHGKLCLSPAQDFLSTGIEMLCER